MRRNLIILALALPALSACSGGDDADSKVTETRMDDIDSIEGTISDEMIPTDEVTETAPVEATPAPAQETSKRDDKAKSARPSPDEPPADSQSGEVE